MASLTFSMQVLDPNGKSQVKAGGSSIGVATVRNRNDTGPDAGLLQRLDALTAVVTHTDGTVDTIPNALSGGRTILPGEETQAVLFFSAKTTDVTPLPVKLMIAGVSRFPVLGPDPANPGGPWIIVPGQFNDAPFSASATLLVTVVP